MGGRDETVEPAGAYFKGPGVVGPAQGVGQIRVLDLALPEQAQGGIDDLVIKSLFVQIGDALAHILPGVGVTQVAVKGGQVLADLFLAVADDRSQQLVHINRLHGFTIDEEPFRPLGVLPHTHGPLAEGRVGIALEYVQWFDEMAITVDESHSCSPFEEYSSPQEQTRLGCVKSMASPAGRC